MTHAIVAFLALLSASCVLLQSAELVPLVSTNASWALFKGRTEVTLPDITAWRTNGFNDAAFTNTPAPFTYGEGYGYGTDLNDMVSQYGCFFLRRTFVITNLGQIAALQLGAKVDDGFVAWVNGTEIARTNMPGGPGTTVTFTNLATGATEPVSFQFYTVASPGGYLVLGTNTLAVQVFNTTTASSDIVFDASLDAILVDTNPPTIVSVTPAPNSVLTNLTEITIQFSEPITGLVADDLNVHGIGATGLSGSGDTYTFTFPSAPYGNVPITWVVGHGITDLAAPPNAFDDNQPGATWSYTHLDVVPPMVAARFPAASAVVQALGQITVTFSEAVNGVNAADLLVNGQPATNVVVQPGAVFVFQFALQPNGPVSVQWQPGHGITDFAAGPNALLADPWSYTVDPDANTYGVVINEINASNQSGLRDEDGEEQDWIELYNAGTNAVDLLGWSLSDEADEPGRWVFPQRVLAPGAYLVVFASAKDRTAPTGTNRLHTNFKLAITGDFLGLFTPDSPRQFAAGFLPKYPVQRNDHSYGPETGGALRYFATPTPGTANGVSTITGVVEPVHFSTARGHFSQPFNLILSCATRGAVIRYSTNGSEPTLVNGLTFSLPLAVNSTFMVRAAAFKTNELPALVESHSFYFNQSAAIRSLPILSIQTLSNNMIGPTGIIGMNGGSGPPANPWVPSVPAVPGEYHNTTSNGLAWERPMSVEYIHPGDNSGFQIDSGMRVQGSDYTRPRYAATDKISYRLYFRGDYSSDRLKYPVFSDGAVQDFDQIVLRAGHNDISNPFLRDELARQLSADMGQVACHGTWVNFFINGVYKGYYNPTERVEEGFLQNWHGGSNSWDILTVGSAVQGGDAVEWNSLRTYVSGQDVTQPAIFTEVLRRMDVVNFIDYLIVNTYGCTWDWPHNNWRAARERAPGGKFRFYVWDAEGAFGEFDGSTATSDSFIARGINPAGVNSPLLNGTAEIPVFYTRLRNSAEFRLLWADRVQKHFFNGGAMTDTNIANRFIQLRTELLGVIPTLSQTILNTFIPNRRAPLLNQFITYGLYGSDTAPAFSQHGSNVPPGFSLTMTASGGGTIYFTTDGADPRVMFTGAVSNSAVAYAAPLVLNQDTLIKARTLTAGNWSALTEATFSVASRGVPLRITEINYNPADSSAYEFIELQNVGSTPLNLSGLYFEGVTFTFPVGSTLAGGARLVLASDLSPGAFAALYSGVSVAGYFAGGLNNGGERLVLKDAAGNIITSLDYDDAGGWPGAADGGGFSLENINPAGDPDDPANWRASTTPGGTPGTANAAPASGHVRLNEVLADNFSAVNHAGTFPDYVELANTSGAPLSLAGWSLTDDGDPRKFVFPPGTIIDANGFLTVWCDALTNTTPGLHSGFAFGRNGDNVHLYDADTNLADALSFGLQLADYSVGRLGAGWVLNTPTTNAANIAATVGDAANLSLNEFLANPAAGLPDWIELFNNSALPVALRGTFLSHTSAVHQITSLSFIAPFGFSQFFADEGVGPDHLDFKLPATGGVIVLYDITATEVNRLSYAAQSEGLTRGRLPDGSGTIMNFPGSASPGTTNYAVTYTGPVLNEVLARNVSAVTNGAGRVADFIELCNSNGGPVSLAGYSLGTDLSDAGRWIFPPDAATPALGYTLVWCDDGTPVSTNSSFYNLGQSLAGESGGVYLFNPAGQVVNAIEYGFQITNRSIGPNVAAPIWRLLTTPTPGAPNGAFAALGAATSLRINVWMANSADGPDWFELFNTTNLPIDLAGLVFTDDPTTSGTNEFRAAPLSFIAAGGFVQWLADAQPEEGRNHVNFDLDALGESIRLYATNGSTILDTVAFGAQPPGVSQGRVPDGSTNVFSLPGSATPAESNYRLITDVALNEILTHANLPLEDAIELRNLTGADVAVGGWFLSDNPAALKKFRFADDTPVVSGGGFKLIYEAQINTGPNAFVLDRARGGELWLSAADISTNLTGFRTRVKFGAAAADVSFGRFEVGGENEFTAQAARTFGDTNARPLVGPVVIHEIMYHPPDGLPGATEFIELRNLASTNVALFDPARPTNTWRLGDGVSFAFPPSTTLAADGFLLVVNFDPVVEVAALTSFRAQYGVSPAVPVFGPYSGQLDNGGETIDLFKPDLPDGAFVPQVRVDKVSYRDSAPWPSGAVDGGGLSLQRRVAGNYGHDAANWLAAAPTAGRTNAVAAVSPPAITQSPASANVLVSTDLLLQAAAAGSGPLSWQWRFNGVELSGQTNSWLFLDYLRVDDSGAYDVYVRNAGGPAFSAVAQVSIVEPPLVLTAPPATYSTNAGSNVTFTVSLAGTPPLRHQWRFNNVNIPGATNQSFTMTNLVLAQSGLYGFTVTNAYGTASTSVAFTVLVRPGISNQPVSQFVLPGQTAIYFVAAGPIHPFLPLTFRLLTNGVGMLTNSTGLFILPNVQIGYTSVRIVVANAAGNVNSSTVTQVLLTDADQDGVGDLWESGYFGLGSTNDPANALLDSDGDGMINRDEFLAGTNPTNEFSLLKLVLSATNTTQLQFVAQTNRAYTLQGRADLSVAPWINLTNIFPASLVRTMQFNSVVAPPGPPERYYRVVTPLSP